MLKISSVLIFFSILLAVTFGCSTSKTPTSNNNIPENKTSLFLSTKGINLIDSNGQTILLKGIAFGNEVWTNSGTPKYHHTKEDFKRVHDMGMNVIRWYMNTSTFEDDQAPYTYKNEGWDWLDSNITWAKEYGIYLNLNVHVPQGGFQSNGEGTALWENLDNQNRLRAFWYNLASRYKDEPAISSFDLLNEPGTTSSKSQWQELAQSIIDTIRQIDSNHIIIVERLNSINKDCSEDKDLNFIKVNDPANQLMYQFHFYEPIEYTHQNTSWTGMGDGGSYPDSNIISVSSAKWVGDARSILLTSNDSVWTEYRGKLIKINNDKYTLAKPSLESSSIGDGEIYLDRFRVIEYDENNDSIGIVFTYNPEGVENYYYWSEDQSGNLTKVYDTVNGGEYVIKISGSMTWANASNNKVRFKTIQGHSYQIIAWMKGKNIPSNASVGMKFDFENSDSEILGRTKQSMVQRIEQYVNWIHQQNVPAYLGEFGLYKECFENDKGGLNWVKDMFDLLDSQNTSFTYHTYHEDSFGLFYDSNNFPDAQNANTKLIELISKKLNP